MSALVVAPRALAFSNPLDFGRYPDTDPFSLGGGAGRYFTGSPADGYGCDVCHSAKKDYSFPIVEKGFPAAGYVPGAKYMVELSWPLAATQEAQALTQGFTPNIELVAEFVAENGRSAGSVAYASMSETDASKFPGLYCARAADAKADQPPEYAMAFYENVPGKKSLEKSFETLDFPYSYSCSVGGEGDDDARRCIALMRPCGAKSVKLVWTAPDEWNGPIWFSAGLVVTYDHTGVPDDDDYVTMLAKPINPAYQGATFEKVLSSGCSVSGVSSPRTGSGAVMFGGACWGLWLGRRSVRRRRRGDSVRGRYPARTVSLLGLLAVSALFTGACSRDRDLVTNVAAPVGLYEPKIQCSNCKEPPACRELSGSAGAPAGAAGGASPRPMATAYAAEAGAAAPGLPSSGSSGGAAASPSLGTLTIAFTSTQPPVISDWARECSGPCDPHYLAVWIEDAAGLYVRTLLEPPRKAFYAATNLRAFAKTGADCTMEPLSIDAMTEATPMMHRAYTLTWDGLIAGATPAPSGMYTLRMEMAIDENTTHEVEKITESFTFGAAAPETRTLPPAGPHSGLTITYTPAP